jgi:hypothetical protein
MLRDSELIGGSPKTLVVGDASSLGVAGRENPEALPLVEDEEELLGLNKLA